MDSNPRTFVLHVSEVGVTLNSGDSEDRVEIVFHGNVTPGDRKRMQRAINNTTGAPTLMNKIKAVPMSIKRLM